MQLVRNLLKTIESLRKRHAHSEASEPEPEAVDRETIKSWRQGMVVPITGAIRQHIPEELPDDALCVVVSHDCDVSNLDFAKEPFVEILILRSAESDGNLRFGKNSRRIELQVTGSTEPPAICHADIHERWRVPRLLLSHKESTAAGVVHEDDLPTLRKWLAKRYDRPAFPDQFNDRLRGTEDAIRKRLKAGGKLVTGIYIALDTEEELPAGVDYKIQLVATMKDDHFTDPDLRDPVQEAFDMMLSCFDDCEGIDVEEDMLLSEADVSLDDLRKGLRRWDQDDLSYRDAAAARPVDDR